MNYNKKKMGQNFLVNDDICMFITEKLRLKPGDNILEIGVGKGSLTKFLVKNNVNYTGIELDKSLYDYCVSRFGAQNDIRFVNRDILKIDIDSLYKKTSYKIAGNIPYSISSPLIFKLIDLKNKPDLIVMMLQKEVGERLCAKPKTKPYNALSVIIQSVFETNLLKIVDKNMFSPVPNVDSALVCLIPYRDSGYFPAENSGMTGGRDPGDNIENSGMTPNHRSRIGTTMVFSLRDNAGQVKTKDFFGFVKKCFRFKRKKLRNNLKDFLNNDVIDELLDSYDDNIRAEEISIEEFRRMYLNLKIDTM